MLGIKNYSPTFYGNSTQIIEAQKAKLDSLKGKEIKEIWVAWEYNDNEWFNDLPVVIKLEDRQLELCAYKAEEYAITFNQIRLSDAIDYYGTDFTLKWEKNKLEVFNQLINKRIVAVELIEVLYDIESQHIVALTGIGLQLEEGYLAVCNGLDENIIWVDRPDGLQFQYIMI